MSARYVSILTVVLLSVISTVALASDEGIAGSDTTQEIEFTDVRQQALQFIHYNNSISLTKQQEAVKREALTAIPAPCCSQYTAHTCCCPCNMAKTIWGLTNFLIAEQGYTADQVRETVSKWIQFINPSGFSGDACFTGGCNKAFKNNGCGGMDESRLVWR